MLYNRREATFQTCDDAEEQVSSLEIWGRGAFRGELLCVKAYPGALDVSRGIEFETGLLPHPHSAPNLSLWYLHDTPGVESRTKDGDDFACISVDIVRNYQPRV